MCDRAINIYLNRLGETIEAKTYPDVTMLFSDIVGFTAICATTTPMMVINMLQNLYEQFDLYCGQLDVYKVRSLKIDILVFHIFKNVIQKCYTVCSARKA